MILFETAGNFATETSPTLYFLGNVALMLAAFCALAHPLARLLLSERRVLGIADVHWNADIVAHAPGSLDIAVPLFARNDLLGIALYGRHRNGTAIDPEERQLLRRLCEAAAVAFEAVDLAQAREELAAMRSLTRLGTA